ncbi:MULTISPECIES: LLM class flavin-dependent oxidoreductase [Sphingomonas]|uniref:LLM class flavin-dependent oxidoreductase n=1 Tax=Edaphosphingomonas fennica TaxID=114404 RepID=A0A2T4I596_9SPHN|nr:MULTISPECIES: LLM class flavin-dependent oxidoreductase [Sphingomonas]AGH50374.1 hypothetical protein G432_13275 [Sphingomonas sp. MM-1]MDX3885718.1 LLM class flavin-dependent oxidoreductase [Sphingomonas sp.]PTD25138.1 LLM class flavin-dependent oxidoreductase [Sphingomonas fennica]
MRFHHAESMTPFENLVPLAQDAEAHGYAGYMIPDSLIYPQETDSKYTYTADGGREFLENKPFVESFILATALGASTTKLELTTNVVKLPVRPPVYSAKLAASVAAITGNRFNFGVGLSVWEEDYAVMGVDFAKRGKRFDECIEIVRGLTNGGYFGFQGEFYDFAPVKLNPVPTRPLPILIGGHSDAALKRAARHDGWLCAGGSYEQTLPLLDKLAAYRAELGTAGRPYRIFTTAMGGMLGLDDVRKLEDAGVTDIAVAFRNLYAVEEDRQPLDEKKADLRRFADEVIAKAG